MIAAADFPPPGTVVACEYRCPDDPNIPPHKGIVLALDDVRPWTGTLKFPRCVYPEGPTQEAATAWVERCLAEGLLANIVPVLWTSSIDGKQFIHWDSKLYPYAVLHAQWVQKREQLQPA